MEKWIVIGGSGRLGSWLVPFLVEANKKVRVGDLNTYSGKYAEKVESVFVDITKIETLKTALKDVDLVFHLASFIDWRGSISREKIEDININGTKNIIQTCLDLGVPKLIYTSSMDVLLDGNPISGGEHDDDPYPSSYLNFYISTKIASEKLVRKANDKLTTVILRPAHLYGPNDELLIQAFSPEGYLSPFTWSKSSNSKMCYLFVGNGAHAHLQVAEKLEKGSKLAGQTYILTENFNENSFRFKERFAKIKGFEMPSLDLPHSLVYGLASFVEFIQPALKFVGIDLYCPFTRFVVSNLGVDFYFNSNKAVRDFDYKLQFTTQQGLEITESWWKSYQPQKKQVFKISFEKKFWVLLILFIFFHAFD